MVEEENNLQPTQNQKSLGSGQKFLAIVLVFSAITVSFFGIWQVKRSIQSPFERVASLNDNSPAGSASSQSEDTSIIEMQNKDTDEDGLSDYEEFYIYKTSPYLADSDSDNIDDKKEIDLGSDPNCQEGKSCGVIDPDSVDVATQPDIVDNEFGENENLDTDLFNFDDFSDLDEVLSSDLFATGDSVSDLFSDLSVSEIRELLIETGLPAEILDQLTDEQLLSAYRTTLENMEE
jgi:hypothetical protein